MSVRSREPPLTKFVVQIKIERLSLFSITRTKNIQDQIQLIGLHYT